MFKKLRQKYKEKIEKFDKGLQEGVMDILVLNDPNSKYFCKNKDCGFRLPPAIMLIKAMNVKNGETYIVKCKKCGKENKVVKGE